MLKYLKYTFIAVPVIFWGLYPKQAVTQPNQIVSLSTFDFTRDSAFVNLKKYKNQDSYTIRDTIDLQGKTWYLPPNVIINMEGGLIRNGAISGNNTRLGNNRNIFDNVRIKGQWIVPIISTSMFKNLAYDNSLKDVLALASPQVRNRIVINKGDYYLKASTNSEECLRVVGNTDVILEGNIVLRPNDFTHYSILYLTGDNISIQGNGCIVGDKPTHTGSKGEWGMGVYIAGGLNVVLEGIGIKDCWGDCVYINRNARKVLIENCTLDNGRRQGISVISAHDVVIRHCKIQNIYGTNPAYAIDVEPNKGDVIGSVLIENVEVSNCRGGFASYGKASDAQISNVVIKDCYVHKTEQVPLSFISTNGITIKNCTISDSQTIQAIECIDVDNVNLKQVRFDGKRIRNNRRCKKLIITKNVKRQKIQ